MAQEDGGFDRKRAMRTIFGICNAAGIERDDRLELAAAILDIGSGLESYTQLSDEDLAIVMWALRHWKIIQALRLVNGTMLREAESLIEIERHRQMEDELDVRRSGRKPKLVSVETPHSNVTDIKSGKKRKKK